MTDLNTLIAANASGLYLLEASAINSSGEIVGLAVTSTGELHGFLATQELPAKTTIRALPDGAVRPP